MVFVIFKNLFSIVSYFIIMIFYIKNREKYDLNFNYNKMDSHDFSMSCVH